MMNTVELRQQINQYLDQLSGSRLQTAADLLAYLVDQESEEATLELLDIPGFVESFERGKKDIAEGRIAHWRAVRSDV
jgi:proline dehydrogenase